MTWPAPLAKPEPRRRAKGRRDRAEAAVKRAVRELVAARDGHCRLSPAHAQHVLGACRGRSTWQHLEKRSLTRGQAPERRHSTANTCMHCERHQVDVDEHRTSFTYRTARGADGPMDWARDGRVYAERD